MLVFYTGLGKFLLKIHNAIENLNKINSSQEDKNKLRYSNELIHYFVLGNPTMFVYEFTFDKE